MEKSPDCGDKLEIIKRKIKEVDYVKFTMVDLNGRTKGKIIPARNALEAMKSGVPMYSGLNAFGPNDELVFPKEVMDLNMDNVPLVPDIDTLRPLPWLGDGKYKTLQFFVEPPHSSSETVNAIKTTFSRCIVKKLLNELDKLGLDIMSGYECEYMLFERKTGDPIYSKDHLQFFSTLLQAEFDDWFTEVDKNIFEAGVNLEAMSTEYSPGQMEFVTAPEFGVKAADGYAILKQGLREMALKRGWQANFMSKPSDEFLGSGTHFNFSIWNKKSGKNVFYDESAPDKLSQFARHWMAGMIKHSAAITAFCCPTVNCYRRLHTPWVPTAAYWGIGNRSAMIRVKNSGPKSTYFENRISGGLANPYLVMAVTIAAGLDGVANKLSCQDEGEFEGVQSLPHTLEESLEALQKDEVIKKAIGEKAVEWFVKTKNDGDFKSLKDAKDSHEKLKLERKLYGETC